jgi:hypothetical protein
MATKIEWLDELPVELQEKILEFASNPSGANRPIEIDGTIYEVPKPVIELIDGLWEELRNMKSNGLQKN